MKTASQCTRVHVKPAPGRTVLVPERGNAELPAEGEEVNRTTYWARRIAAGDVEVIPPTQAKKAAEK